MKERDRKQLLARYGRMYSWYEFERMPGGFGCFYCAEPADTMDHCPPLSQVECMRMSDWRRRGVKFWKIPACMHCNTILGNRLLVTPFERLRRVEAELLDRFERKSVVWTDEEIAEMSPEFQRTIRARMSGVNILLGRVRAAQWRYVRESSRELEEA